MGSLYGGHPRICQTPTASPAEPGDLLGLFRDEHGRIRQHCSCFSPPLPVRGEGRGRERGSGGEGPVWWEGRGRERRAREVRAGGGRPCYRTGRVDCPR